MKRGRIVLLLAVAVVAVVLVAIVSGRDDAAAAPAESAPVLSVSLTTPRVETLPVRVPASGSIVAWQEASIGADTEALWYPFQLGKSQFTPQVGLTIWPITTTAR